ncbi:MAG TPA: cupin domain-containing protein [Polyangiales bacterium]|nr:cupin domain-containing protein [Polyangiales bacterium]
MAFIDTKQLAVLDKRPGWRGRLFHSQNNTFVWWEFDRGADIHRHDHEQEEVWHVIDGELEVTVAETTQRCGPGTVVIIPPSTPHSVLVLSAGHAIVVDHPLRTGFAATP